MKKSIIFAAFLISCKNIGDPLLPKEVDALPPKEVAEKHKSKCVEINTVSKSKIWDCSSRAWNFPFQHTSFIWKSSNYLITSRNAQEIAEWPIDCSGEKVTKLNKPVTGIYSKDVWNDTVWYNSYDNLVMLNLKDKRSREFNLAPGRLISISSGGGISIATIVLDRNLCSPNYYCAMSYICDAQGCKEFPENIEGSSISPSGEYVAHWKKNQIQILNRTTNTKQSKTIQNSIYAAAVDDMGFSMICTSEKNVPGLVDNFFITKCSSSPLANPWASGLFLLPFEGEIVRVNCNNESYLAKIQFISPHHKGVWVSEEKIYSFGEEIQRIQTVHIEP